MKYALFFILLFLKTCSPSSSSDLEMTDWTLLESRPTEAHLRGLYAVNEKIIWASGSGSTVIKSLDAGKSWDEYKVNQEDLQFRDVYAWSDKEAIIMASSENLARFFKTKDGGASWYSVYSDDTEGVFFDAMDFNKHGHGLAMSDQINGKLHLIHSMDKGESWQVIKNEMMPNALEGEAAFAASGTNVIYREDDIYIVTGGASVPRLYKNPSKAKGRWTVTDVPLESGEATGIFSFTLAENGTDGIAVGGSYIDSTNFFMNCAITEDAGKSWSAVSYSPPHGYRSCVAFHPDGKYAVAVGRTGSDYSLDKGKTWKNFSEEGFYACVFLEDKVVAVGRSGKVGRLVLD